MAVRKRLRYSCKCFSLGCILHYSDFKCEQNFYLTNTGLKDSKCIAFVFKVISCWCKQRQIRSYFGTSAYGLNLHLVMYQLLQSRCIWKKPRVSKSVKAWRYSLSITHFQYLCFSRCTVGWMPICGRSKSGLRYCTYSQENALGRIQLKTNIPICVYTKL